MTSLVLLFLCKLQLPEILYILANVSYGRLGLAVALFVHHETYMSRCSSGSHLLRLFLIVEMVILGTTLIITMVLVCHSGRGTIMNTAPRRHVPNLILTRYFLNNLLYNFVLNYHEFQEQKMCCLFLKYLKLFFFRIDILMKN